MVPYALSAQKMIVLFKYKNNISGAIVNTNQSGLTFNYQKNHAKTNLYEVIFKNVELNQSDLLESLNFWDTWISIVYISQILNSSRGCWRFREIIVYG